MLFLSQSLRHNVLGLWIAKGRSVDPKKQFFFIILLFYYIIILFFYCFFIVFYCFFFNLELSKTLKKKKKKEGFRGRCFYLFRIKEDKRR